MEPSSNPPICLSVSSMFSAGCGSVERTFGTNNFICVQGKVSTKRAPGQTTPRVPARLGTRPGVPRDYRHRTQRTRKPSKPRHEKSNERISYETWRLDQ